MTQQIINVGTTANSGTGDTLRAAGTKINANFTELYTTQFQLPNQNNNAGKALITNGAVATWQPVTVTNGVLTTGSYSDPSWITSLSYGKISGAPGAYTLPFASTSTLGGVKAYKPA